MMSGPELPYKISSSEEALALLRKLIKRLDDMCLRFDKPTSRNIFSSSDLATDPSAGIYYVVVIAQGFLGTFILNSSCHDFEKVDEGRKMSSQLWYTGRKINNLMWLHMAGEFMSINILGYSLSSQLWLRMAGYLDYIPSRYVFISSFVSLTKYVGRKLNNVMWLRMAGEFMSIQINISQICESWTEIQGYHLT